MHLTHHLPISQLIGTWSLLNITGTTVHYGPNLIGRIIITPDSYFNAMITDLPSLPPNVTWSNATDAQKGVIAKTMTVYEGMVTVVEDDPAEGLTFTHTWVESSLNPTWTHTVQVRQAELGESDGKWILKLTPWANSTGVWMSSNQTLIWERMLPP